MKADKSAISALSSLIDSAEKIVVSSHTHPDGDALGSTVALVEYLRRSRGKDASGVICNSPGRDIAFICDGNGNITFHDSEPEKAESLIAGSDLLILLDCNGFSRTDSLESIFKAYSGRKVLIDHHMYPERDSFDLVFSETEISSSAELLYGILLRMDDVAMAPENLPAESAAALLTGMTTDTNNFSNSVYPSTLEMASGLLRAGVQRDAIIDRLYRSGSEDRVRMTGYMQWQRMVTLPSGAAYIVIRSKDIEEFRIVEGDTEGLVNIPLTIGNIRISLLLREDPAGYFRVSIRSKGDLSARELAAGWFNGGGHFNASGGRLYIGKDIASPDDAVPYVEKAIMEYLG